MLPLPGNISQQSIVAGGGGGPPVVQAVVRTNFTTGSTTHNGLMPTGVQAGDLLLIVAGMDGNPTVTATGFTSVYSGANSTAARCAVLAKVADGTESGATVNVATSASEAGGTLAYRITNWGGTIATHIVAGTTVTSSTATHNPPSLTSGFGAVDTIWFAVGCMSGTPNISTYPSGYSYAPGTSGLAGAIGGTTAGLAVSCWKTTIAASEDPGAITMAGSVVGLSSTIAIKGA